MYLIYILLTSKSDYASIPALLRLSWMFALRISQLRLRYHKMNYKDQKYISDWYVKIQTQLFTEKSQDEVKRAKIHQCLLG